jgi:L-ascorbate metabolism protein UlaG (beta-lactamase superfamily)
MKITKFVHSCLLVEDQQRVAIFDPGNFSWESGLFKIDNLIQLDDIIITHEHPDHFYLPFIQALLSKFPQTRITTTSVVAEELTKQAIKNTNTESNEVLTVRQVTHETMVPLAPPPNSNLVVHYLDRLTHPGDSHHFDESKEVLALPINAPWGTWRRAAEFGLELKPKIIIPIHDWHLSNDAREGAYERFEFFFKEHGIRFVKIQNGEPFEV